MMVLPFLLFVLAFWYGWKGRKTTAVLLFVVNLVVIALLFRFHVTSHLDLRF